MRLTPTNAHSTLRDAVWHPGSLMNEGSDRAISWFRSTAREAIDRVRRICYVLEEHGYHVQMLKTKDPGTILYEDEWQVVAFPPRGKPLTNRCS